MGRRATGRVLIADALVGSWTEGELIAFGFRRMLDGGWLAPVDWRTR